MASTNSVQQTEHTEQVTISNDLSSNSKQIINISDGFIDVYFQNEVHFPALVDTGATFSVIREAFLKRLKLPASKFSHVHTRITLANGQRVVARQQVHLKFHINNQPYSLDFLVLKQLTRPLILGVDFLKKYKALINFDTDYTLITRPILAAQKVTLPPFSEYTIKGKLVSEQQYTKEHCGVTENLDRGQYVEIPYLIKKAIVSPDKHNCCPVTLLNLTHSKRIVACGEIVALYSPLNDEEIIPLKTQQRDLHVSQAPHSGTQIKHAFSLPCDESPRPTCCKHVRQSMSNEPGLTHTTQGVKHTDTSQSQHDPINSSKAAINSDEEDIIKKPESVDFIQLSEAQRKILEALLAKYNHVFVGPTNQLGCVHFYEHEIRVDPHAKPYAAMPYRQSPMLQNELEKIIQQQLEQGVIERSDYGEWASPAFLVKKHTTPPSYRLVVDYRRLNAVSYNQVLPIPRIDSTLDQIGQTKPKIFSSLDLMSGFHQIPIRKQDRHYTAFLTPSGRYQFKRLPMGISSAPRSFQAVLNAIFANVSYKFILVYMDDLLIYSRTFEEHMSHLDQVFRLLESANLKLKRPKCHFCTSSIEYLGFVINSRGISPSAGKVEAIRSFPVPATKSKLRSFIGMAQFLRKFIRNFSKIAKPLFELMSPKTKYIWSEECQKAFDELKDALSSETLLLYPDFSKTFYLLTDASDYSIGVTLLQMDDSMSLKPISFSGRSLNKAEMNYCVTDRELLAIIYGVMHFRVYLESSKFVILTDHHALTYLMTQKHLLQRQIRWQLLLNSFDFEIRHISGSKNKIADALSRREYPFNFTQTDEKIKEVLEEQLLPTANKLETGCLPPAARSSINSLLQVSDTGCSNGCSNEQPQLQVITRRSARLSARAEDPGNTQADSQIRSHVGRGPTKSKAPDSSAPVRQSNQLPLKMRTRRRLMEKLTPQVQAKVRQVDTVCPSIKLTHRNIKQLQSQDPLCKDIILYLEQNITPKNAADRRWILANQDKFLVLNNILFEISDKTRNEECNLRIVVPKVLQAPIIQIFHDSALASHPGVAKTLYAIKQYFWWFKMNSGITHYCVSCPVCLKSKRSLIHAKPPLTIRNQSVYPFQHMSLDTLKVPKAKTGEKYIQVCIDLNSKYVIAWGTSSISAEALASEFNKNVICVYGAPEKIFTDNGSNFVSQVFKNLCRLWNIKQIFSSSFNPKSQGQVERLNRTLLTKLRSLVNLQADNWPELLPSVVFAINTSPAYATGVSPALLVFGRTPVNPYLSVGMSELQVQDIPQSVWDQFQQRVDLQAKLQLSAENRQNKVNAYMNKHYDLKANSKTFTVNQLVYIFIPRTIFKGTQKLQSFYHGPYKIMAFTTPNTVSLKRLSDNKVLTKSVHISRLKAATMRDWKLVSGGLVTNIQNLPVQYIDPLINRPIIRPQRRRIVATKRKAPLKRKVRHRSTPA